MSTDRSPSSLDGIKRLAKHIRNQNGVAYSEALRRAAQAAGFENFKHAQNNLAPRAVTRPAVPATEHEFPFPGRTDFHARSLRLWISAVRKVNPAGVPSLGWSEPAAIIRTLRPFLGQNCNHAHLPSGGGHDILEVKPSVERGCLEFKITEGLAYVVRPIRLTLEVIESEPGESFLLLELGALPRMTNYEPSEGLDADIRERLLGSEELLELTPGEYFDRSLWDENEGPDGEPLPDSARLVVRWMRGKILFVAKGSRWNGSSRTYRGIHNGMSATDIRSLIERSISRAA